MWCVAELDAEYIEKMEDVLAVYEKPVSLHSDVRPPSPAAPGKLARQDNEYERCGTANVFAIIEPKAGLHLTEATPDRCAARFAEQIRKLVGRYPFARTIHLVMDNLNIHCRKSATDRFGSEEGGYLWDRLTVHYTPKHGSWLNQAEIELSLFARQCLGNRRISDFKSLKQETRTWARQATRKRLRIDWQFTRQKARTMFRYRRRQ